MRFGKLAALAVAGLVIAGCGADDSDANILGHGGWPGIHNDAANSDYSDVTGSRELSLAWSRPIGGPIAAYASVGATGQLFVTANNEAGCNLWSFQLDTARKRFCNRLNPGVVASTPIVDAEINIYVGEAGGMSSFNEHGQPRWRTPVIGTPISAQFTPDGNVLFVTQLAQAYVVDRQTGKFVTAPFELFGRPDVLANADSPVIPDDQGLRDCFAGGQDCAVANTPALDLKTGRFYLTVRAPGAPNAALVALSYNGGEHPSITRFWSVDILSGGSAVSPTLSADGTTVYAADNSGKLLAVDAENGNTKWTYDLGFAPLGSAAVAPDGLIIPAGGRDGHMLAVRDEGDRAELAWERKDLVQLGVPAQTAGHTGYTVAKGSGDELALITFDTESGATVDTDALPGSTGFTVGTSIGPKGEVLVPTALGELYVFKQPK